MGASGSRDRGSGSPRFDDIWADDSEAEPLFKPASGSGSAGGHSVDYPSSLQSTGGGGGGGGCCARLPKPCRLLLKLLLALSVLALDASYLWLVADGVLRSMAGECGAIIAHYAIVGLVLLLVNTTLAWSTISAWRAARHAAPARTTEEFGGSSGGDNFAWDMKSSRGGGGLRFSSAGFFSCCESGGCLLLKRVVIALFVLVLLWQAVFFAMWRLAAVYTVDSASLDAETLRAPGLTAPVSVEWERGVDGSGGADAVLHITAQNNLDLFFAQGYVCAQLRLWQMEFQRRLAAGRLSEVLGEAALEEDRLMRTLGIQQAAQASLAHLDADTLAAVGAYARGVNAYLASRPRLPIEFRALGITDVEPWTAVDTVSWGKIMSFDLSGNVAMELKRFALREHGVPEARIEALLPPFNGPSSTTTMLGIFQGPSHTRTTDSAC